MTRKIKIFIFFFFGWQFKLLNYSLKKTVEIGFQKNLKKEKKKLKKKLQGTVLIRIHLKDKDVIGSTTVKISTNCDRTVILSTEFIRLSWFSRDFLSCFFDQMLWLLSFLANCCYWQRRRRRNDWSLKYLLTIELNLAAISW